jgi:hypothetical protein
VATQAVELLYQAWSDFDHATDGLSALDAEARHNGLSSVAWTAGHLGQQIDSWFNVRFGGGTPHPLLGQAAFRTGSSGKAPAWVEVQAAVSEVRQMAHAFLDGLAPEDMERVVVYTGGIKYLRATGLKQSYALMRTAAHHFLHTGEVLTLRSMLGHDVPDSWTWGERLL